MTQQPSGTLSLVVGAMAGATLTAALANVDYRVTCLFRA